MVVFTHYLSIFNIYKGNTEQRQSSRNLNNKTIAFNLVILLFQELILQKCLKLASKCSISPCIYRPDFVANYHKLKS